MKKKYHSEWPLNNHQRKQKEGAEKKLKEHVAKINAQELVTNFVGKFNWSFVPYVIKPTFAEYIDRITKGINYINNRKEYPKELTSIFFCFKKEFPRRSWKNSRIEFREARNEIVNLKRNKQ